MMVTSSELSFRREPDTVAVAVAVATEEAAAVVAGNQGIVLLALTNEGSTSIYFSDLEESDLITASTYLAYRLPAVGKISRTT
jgi:hypothetical protein